MSARTLARRAATALAGAALAAGLGLAVPTAAGAADAVTVSCRSAGKMDFTPGVQLIPLPQHVQYNGQTGGCQDNSGIHITSARLSAAWQGVVLTCELGGFGTGNGTGTIEWTTEEGRVADSTVDLHFDHNVGPLVAITGTVTDGPFTGHTFSSTYTTDLFGGAGKCTLHAPFGGVTEANFNGQFTIG